MHRVLFVDDDTSLLDGLKRALRPMRDEFEMFFAGSGAEALGFLETTAVDVVVSDMKMPEMNGEQLLAAVSQRFPGVARIILSGHCRRETAYRVLGSENLFIPKPCSSALLRQTIYLALAAHADARPSQPLSLEEVTEVLIEYFGSLIARGDVRIEDVPPIVLARLGPQLLDSLAPAYKELEAIGEFLESDEDSDDPWLKYL